MMVPFMGHLLRILERGILALGVLLADAFGLVHLVRLLLGLRPRIARRLLDLARIDELLRALVVILAGRVAAFAFGVLVLAVHAMSPGEVAPEGGCKACARARGCPS